MKIDHMKNLLYLLPCLFLWAAIRYAWDSYSPVPFWDTWDAFMIVIKRLQQGDWTILFSSPNGHRITLARLLFLGDYYFVKSHFSALIAINITLMVVSFILLARLSRKYLGRYDPFCLCLVGCLVFLLSQAENIRWEFQSQFFLAQIIPLAAFMCFANALDDNTEVKGFRFFCASMLFAALANFTMGNGFLAILMIFLSLFLVKSNFAVKCSVFLLATLSVASMFMRKAAIPNLGNAAGSIDLAACAKYFFVYLGSPFQHVAKFYGARDVFLVYIAATFGLAFCIAFLFCVWHSFKKRNLDNKYALVGLCMIVYVVFSACLVTITRYQYGVEQAASERYTTPVLMAWTSLLILLWPMLEARGSVFLKRGIIICILILLPYQQLVARDKLDGFNYQVPFWGDMLMMSLWLGVDDPGTMQKLHPDPSRIRKVVNERKNDAAFFTNSPQHLNMQHMLSQEYELKGESAGQCRLHMDEIRTLEQTSYQYVQGWFKYEEYDGGRHFLLIYNQDHEKIGYMVVGQPRLDVSRNFSDNDINVGLAGYISGEFLQPEASLYFYNPENSYHCLHVMK